MNGVDYIIHLAALSNDPLGELNPNLTNEINYLSTKIANLSKQNGVRRFVYVSSQSMYGISDNNIELDEMKVKKNQLQNMQK